MIPLIIPFQNTFQKQRISLMYNILYSIYQPTVKIAGSHFIANNAIFITIFIGLYKLQSSHKVSNDV